VTGQDDRRRRAIAALVRLDGRKLEICSGRLDVDGVVALATPNRTGRCAGQIARSVAENYEVE
jgi:hypothetical protein